MYGGGKQPCIRRGEEILETEVMYALRWIIRTLFRLRHVARQETYHHRSNGTPHVIYLTPVAFVDKARRKLTVKRGRSEGERYE